MEQYLTNCTHDAVKAMGYLEILCIYLASGDILVQRSSVTPKPIMQVSYVNKKSK
jgi:hypothetical protein